MALGNVIFSSFKTGNTFLFSHTRMQTFTLVLKLNEAGKAVNLYTSIFHKNNFGKNAVQTLLVKNNFIDEIFPSALKKA